MLDEEQEDEEEEEDDAEAEAENKERKLRFFDARDVSDCLFTLDEEQKEEEAAAEGEDVHAALAFCFNQQEEIWFFSNEHPGLVKSRSRRIFVIGASVLLLFREAGGFVSVLL